MRTCLDLADRLGAKAIASHALLLAPFDRDPEGCEARMAEFLAGFAEAAEGSPAQVAFENPGYDCPAQARALRALDRLDAVSRAAYGFVLDTGHANIDGDLAEIGARVGDHLISLHLNDNDGRADAHLAPGEGTVDWSAVRAMLRGAGYRGVVLHEVERNGGDPVERMRATMEGHKRYLDGILHA
jgi:sugar phosphate isomerase/epimerase